MDYEKAYKEALEKAKKELNTCGSQDCDAARQIFRFFPELVESEDEKIRKSLIILLQHFCKGYRVPGLEFPVSYKDMLAWLEKQGNPTNDDMKEALRTEYEKGRADAIAQMQKEWSEEDEVKINRIVACLENLNVADNDILLKDVDWLKSLKDRYTWKPSDAQIRALEYIINNAHNTSYSCKIAKELLEQLKKLKGH